MADDQLFARLKGKYASVISAAPQLGIELQNVHMENGKLLIRGRAPNEVVRNEIWNRIKAIDSGYSDLTADISVGPVPSQAGFGQVSAAETGSGLGFGNFDLRSILDRYADRDDADGNEDDFDQVAQHAPPSVVSQGVAEAFRSDRTPPFPNMLSQMFGQSDPNTRAGILNQLIAAAGPAILSGMLNRGGTGGSGLGGLLGGLLGGGFGQTGAPRVTPEQASQVPPEVVEELARESQKNDPDVISRVSDFAARNPALVKGLGAAALGIALKHLAGQKRGGLF